MPTYFLTNGGNLSIINGTLHLIHLSIQHGWFCVLKIVKFFTCLCFHSICEDVLSTCNNMLQGHNFSDTSVAQRRFGQTEPTQVLLCYYVSCSSFRKECLGLSIGISIYVKIIGYFEIQKVFLQSYMFSSHVYRCPGVFA